MTFKRKLFEATTEPLARLMRIANRATVSLAARGEPVYNVETPDGPLRFVCRNELTLWRAQTLYTKEPDTIAWIDGMQPGEVLYDVGANMGLYTLYAAKRGLWVHALEPESQNYALLNKNIHVNGLSSMASAYQIALSARRGLDFLFVKDFTPGGALNNYGSGEDYNKRAFQPEHRQPVLSFTLDEFVTEFNLPFPTHLKIDVDGLESEILSGAKTVLADERLNSILIEINEALPEDLALKDVIEKAGFALTSRYHAPMFDGGAFEKINNYIFKRDVR